MSEIKQFNGGAVRGSNPPEYTRITHEFLRRVGEAMTRGAVTYPDHADGVENWKHGDREFARAAWNHCVEHLLAWKDATEYPDRGDDHLAHAACNLMMLMWFETGGVWDPYEEERARDIDAQYAYRVLPGDEEEEVIDVESVPPEPETPKERESRLESRIREILGLTLRKMKGEQ